MDEIILPQSGLRVAFWKITEEEETLMQMYAPGAEEENFICGLKGERKRHYLASRLLCNAFFPDCKIEKDEYGKPHLQPGNSNISWSHSGEYAAFISNQFEATGIDIEQINSRILRIQDKFCNASDVQAIHPEHVTESLLIIWAAKESMYKLYGKKEVDFRKHMTVEKFAMNTEGKFIGRFHLQQSQTFEMEYRFFNNYVAVWVNKSL